MMILNDSTRSEQPFALALNSAEVEHSDIFSLGVPIQKHPSPQHASIELPTTDGELQESLYLAPHPPASTNVSPALTMVSLPESTCASEIEQAAVPPEFECKFCGRMRPEVDDSGCCPNAAKHAN